SRELGLTAREIGRSLSISHPTVLDYLSRAKKHGLAWPLPDHLDEAALERLLCGPSSVSSPSTRPQPDCVYIHQELKKKGVTLQLLWQEYKEMHPSGYQYTQFCEYYRKFAKKLDLSLRQHHKAGDRLFVDYAGQTIPVSDPDTGEIRAAQIFVAVLGASNYTYAEAAYSQELPAWISAHVRAFEFFGGVPSVIVPDNLKSAVIRTCRYEPDLNPTYQEMAAHYGAAVLPARARKPKDKAKVEVGVLIVTRWILAPLRNRSFLGLDQLNTAIRELLDALNARPFKKMDGCRHSLFETLDLPAMKPLPSQRYVYAEWKKARVNIDYHVEVEGHYYSVPYTLVREQIDVRMTATTIECLHRGERIASHLRSMRRGQHTTQKAHMPASHRRHLQWTPIRMIAWAEKVGPCCTQVVKKILLERRYPEQGFRSCLGILRLGKSYTNDRLEAACQRALAIRGCSYKSIASILKHGLDLKPIQSETEPKQAVAHANIRGARYYQTNPSNE
ncbi:MAG: IS21 family transposase, partial [Nitrospiria bacterium]